MLYAFKCFFLRDREIHQFKEENAALCCRIAAIIAVCAALTYGYVMSLIGYYLLLKVLTNPMVEKI